MSALLWEENVLFSIEVQSELEKVMSATIWKSLCQIGIEESLLYNLFLQC